jgi:LmbE family N-acetylglucosaminyl deacetylase
LEPYRYQYRYWYDEIEPEIAAVMLDVVDVIECKLASAGDRKLLSQPPTVFAAAQASPLRTAMCQRVVETLLYRRKSQGYSSSDLAAAIPGFRTGCLSGIVSRAPVVRTGEGTTLEPYRYQYRYWYDEIEPEIAAVMLDVVDVIECKLASAGDRKLQSQAQPPTVFASQHSEQGVPVYSRKAGSNTKWMWHASLRSAQHAIGVCHHHIKQCCDGQRQSATRIADKDGSQFQFRFGAMMA